MCTPLSNNIENKYFSTPPLNEIASSTDGITPRNDIVTLKTLFPTEDTREVEIAIDSKVNKLKNHLIVNGYHGLSILCSFSTEELFTFGRVNRELTQFASELSANYFNTQGISDRDFEESLAVSLWHLARGALDSQNLSDSERFEISHDLIASGFGHTLRTLFAHRNSALLENFLQWWIEPEKGIPYAILHLHAQSGFYLETNLLHRSELSRSTKFHVLRSMMKHTAYAASHLQCRDDTYPFAVKKFVEYLRGLEEPLTFEEGLVIVNMLRWASKLPNLEDAVAIIEKLHQAYLSGLNQQKRNTEEVLHYRVKLILVCRGLSKIQDNRINKILNNLRSHELPSGQYTEENALDTAWTEWKKCRKNAEWGNYYESAAVMLTKGLESDSKEIREDAIDAWHRELYATGGSLEIKLIIKNLNPIIIRFMTLIAEETDEEKIKKLFECLYLLMGNFKNASILKNEIPSLIAEYQVPNRTRVLFMKKVKDVLDLTPNESGRLQWCGAMASVPLSLSLVQILDLKNGYRELIRKAEETEDPLCYAASIQSLLPQLKNQEQLKGLTIPNWMLRKPSADALNRVFDCVKTFYVNFFGTGRALYSPNFHVSLGYHIIATDGQLLYNQPYNKSENNLDRRNSFNFLLGLTGLEKMLNRNPEKIENLALETIQKNPLSILLRTSTRSYATNNHYTVAANKVMIRFIQLMRLKAPELFQKQLSQVNWHEVVGIESSNPQLIPSLHPEHVLQSILCMLQIGQVLTDKELVPLAKALKDSLPLVQDAGVNSNRSSTLSIPFSEQTISQLHLPVLDIAPTLHRLRKIWPKEYYTRFLQTLILTRDNNSSVFSSDSFRKLCELHALSELEAANAFPSDEPLNKSQLPLLTRYFITCDTATPGTVYTWKWVQIQLTRLSPALFYEWLKDLHLNVSSRGLPEKKAVLLFNYALSRPAKEVLTWKNQLLTIVTQSISMNQLALFKERIEGISRQVSNSKELKGMHNDKRKLQEALSRTRENLQTSAQASLKKYQNLAEIKLFSIKPQEKVSHISLKKIEKIRENMLTSANSEMKELIETENSSVDTLQKKLTNLSSYMTGVSSNEQGERLDIISQRIADITAKIHDIHVPVLVKELEISLQQIIETKEERLYTALHRIEQEEDLRRGEVKANEIEQLSQYVMKVAGNALETLNSGDRTEDKMNSLHENLLLSLRQHVPVSKSDTKQSKRLQHDQSLNQRLQEQMRKMQARMEELELENARLRKAAAEKNCSSEEEYENVDIDSLIETIRKMNTYKDRDIPERFSSELSEAWTKQKGRLKKLSRLLSAIPLNSKGEIRLQDMQSIAFNSGFVKSSMKGDHLTIKHSVFHELVLTMVTNRKDKQIFYLRYLLEKVEESLIKWQAHWN